MAQRSTYWSCTKFADWVRGTPKPSSETAKGWSSWRKTARATHSFRFWLAEEGLDKIQSFIWWPVDKLYSVKYYINNRWVTKSHQLTAHPSDVKPGQWCDLTSRILYCLFNELVDFVEVEQAWCYIAWDTAAREKFKAPWWSYGWFRWRTWRSPEAGLAYLDWASSLKLDDEWVKDTDPEYGKPTNQALAAQEIKALYLWWKDRPNRPDPYEASGWNAVCDRRRSKDPDDFLCSDDTDEERAESKSTLDICNDMEAKYEAEDEEMLIRLIKIRNHLWT